MVLHDRYLGLVPNFSAMTSVLSDLTKKHQIWFTRWRSASVLFLTYLSHLFFRLMCQTESWGFSQVM